MTPLEELRGWPYHHFDCPVCEEEFSIEYDPTGEVIECPHCETKYIAG